MMIEYGARTIRGKIQAKLPEYLKPFPEVTANPPDSLDGCPPIDWDNALASLQINREVPEVTWLQPGPTAALEALQTFIHSPKLKDFGDKRNDPNLDVISNLSPYIHFGQISVQKIVLELKLSKKYPSSADVFIEEAVVRRELADNFCFCKFNLGTVASLLIVLASTEHPISFCQPLLSTVPYPLIPPPLPLHDYSNTSFIS
jgi:deoxyribodipyrimidine photo-lyase